MEEEKVSVPTVVIHIRLQKYSTSKEKQSVTHQYLVTTSRHLALIPGDMEVVIVFKVCIYWIQQIIMWDTIVLIKLLKHWYNNLILGLQHGPGHHYRHRRRNSWTVTRKPSQVFIFKHWVSVCQKKLSLIKWKFYLLR